MSTHLPGFQSYFRFFAYLAASSIYAAGGEFDQKRNGAKTLENDWNPGKWVLIWEYSVRAIQWIPTWRGLDGFQKSLQSCPLDESSPSIGRVNPSNAGATFVQSTRAQRFLKIIQTPSCWYSLDSSHWVLSYEYPFARVSIIFRCFVASCIGQVCHQLHIKGLTNQKRAGSRVDPGKCSRETQAASNLRMTYSKEFLLLFKWKQDLKSTGLFAAQFVFLFHDCLRGCSCYSFWILCCLWCPLTF